MGLKGACVACVGAVLWRASGCGSSHQLLTIYSVKSNTANSWKWPFKTLCWLLARLLHGKMEPSKTLCLPLLQDKVQQIGPGFAPMMLGAGK